MNFAITGKKIVSTQPQKKLNLPPNGKSKIQQKPKQVIKPVIRKPSIPITKNNQVKIEQKKQQLKKQPLKSNEHQVSQNHKQKDIQQSFKSQTKQDPKIEQTQKIQVKVFEIVVRYNHYKDKFSVENNVLKYQVIEDKYSFSSVFKGNFQPRLQIYRNYGKYIEPLTNGTALQFSWQVEEGKQYEITIAEDEEQESKYERKIYIAPKQQKKCSCKKNQRVVQLTKQMRQMAVEQLGGQKHRQLIEQRALQQILFS